MLLEAIVPGDLQIIRKGVVAIRKPRHLVQEDDRAFLVGNLSVKDADTYRRFLVVVNGDKVLLRCLPKGISVSFK